MEIKTGQFLVNKICRSLDKDYPQYTRDHVYRQFGAELASRLGDGRRYVVQMSETIYDYGRAKTDLPEGTTLEGDEYKFMLDADDRWVVLRCNIWLDDPAQAEIGDVITEQAMSSGSGGAFLFKEISPGTWQRTR